VNLDGCTALVTGASAGLGREFARQLAARAGALVLVARRVDRLEELRNELTARDPNLNVLIRAVDLSRHDEVIGLAEWLQREGIAIDLLINNAGIGDHGRFATGAPERLTSMIAVNVAALSTLTRALLPAMIERKRGAILNVSSSASFLPLPDLAAYAATKAYVTSLSEALRMELRATGVGVTALCPGPVHTEFNTIASRPDEKSQQAPEFTYVAPGEVVRAGLKAIERGAPLTIPGVVMKLAMFLVRITPLPILRLAARVQRR
jgi:short-subunit dehydrogenase